MPLPITDVFADLPDPRSEVNRRHLMTDILTIALCVVISGADGWEDIAECGRSKRDFLKRFQPLPNGIPSHDTFYRVFARLDPAAFAQRVGRWMASACEATGLSRSPSTRSRVGGRRPRPRPVACIRLVRGPRRAGRRWARRPYRTDRTKSPSSPTCSAFWTWPGRSSPSTRPGVRPRTPG